jgi:ribosomal protein L13
MSYTFTSGQILTAADLNAVVAQTATTATNASTLATGTVVETVLPYRMNQNVTSTSNVTFANVVITGNLTVQGITTSINTSNLDITDLNITVAKNAANSLQANGAGLTVAGADVQFYYNDTSNNMILNIPISIGNSTGNATLSSTNFNVNGAFIANTTGAYHTGIVNATTIQATATFTANATLVNAAAINITGRVNTATFFATTTANVGANVQANTSALFIGNSTVNSTISAGNLNVNGVFIANNSGAYHTGTINAASHTVGATFTANATLVNAAAINITGQVNTVTLYATTSANIASAVQANATGLWTTGTVNAASHTVGATFTANATLVNAAAINITGQVNTATFYATTTANVGANVQLTTSTLFIGNSTVNATVNSTTFSGVSLTANNATYLGGVIAASYIVSTANINFTGANIYFGNATTTSNVYFQNNSVIYANNRFGTVNQLLASNGTSMYWSDASAIAANQLYAFTWTNTHTYGNTTQQANVVFANGVIIANSAFGTSGQALTSDGTKMYWSTITGVNSAAQYSWTNTHSFSAVVTHTANISVNGAIILGGSNGTVGQVLTSNGNANVYWSTLVGVNTSAQYTFTNTIVFSANSFAPTMANGTSNTSIATTAYVQNSLARIYYANGTQAFP